MPSATKRRVGEIPTGFKLRHTLQGHGDVILRVTWSPDGKLLVSTSVDKTIRIWDAATGQPIHTLQGHSQGVNDAAWSPNMRVLASSSFDRTIRIWSAQTGEHLLMRGDHENDVPSIAWSPDGKTLASGSIDKTILLWDTENWEIRSRLLGHTGGVHRVAWSPDGKKLVSCSHDKTIRIWKWEEGEASAQTLEGHKGQVISIAWSPDGRLLASSSFDRTVRLWNSDSGREIGILEGHTASVRSVSFSADNRILSSNSLDGTVRLWRCDTWEMIGKLDEEPARFWPPGVAFSPIEPVLATLGEQEMVIRIWDLDFTELLGASPTEKYDQYVNAKVVLVGDTGVGKSGLGLVLTGQDFVATESTHSRHVWDFDRQEVELDGGRKETRETLLWDLAGQPGYRLVHQLSLNEVAVALVVFDARSESDPFTGVRYWDRALRTAQRVQAESALSMKKYLVAARVDRGGIAVSQERISSLVRDLGMERYFETSAREKWHIAELAAAIRAAIDWDALPKISSSELFQKIKAFLIKEKEARRLLSAVNDLYRAYLNTPTPPDTEELRAQFETCVGRVESRGLIRRLSFGNLVLLQPELLDAYASAIMQLLEQQIPQIKSVAVIMGKGVIGPWQQMESDAFLREFVGRRCPVIPVLLPDAPRKPELPIFLRGMTWVDFRKDEPDPMEQLIWGITGVRITG